MLHYLKKIYAKVAGRIYSVGKLEYDKMRIANNLGNMESVQPTHIDATASIINLSGTKSNIKVGAHAQIYGSLTVMPYGGRITIGNYSSLGDLSRIVSNKGITIGDRVLISHNVNIIDNNSHPLDAELRHADFVANFNGRALDYGIDSKEIVIEDDVWIGFNCIILKGVTIGKGAIIGAGSVVSKDVEPWTVNVGNPLRCVKRLK